MTNGTPDWFRNDMQQILAVQRDLQEKQLNLMDGFEQLLEIQLENGKQISELRKVTADLVGYSITQESDIQTIREDLQVLKRRVDAIDNSDGV